MSIRREDGAIEGYVLLALLGLTGFTVVVAVMASMLIRIEHTRSAADLAALAAASAGSCEVGADAAARNGAALELCIMGDSQTVVAVRTPSGLGPLLLAAGAPRTYRASARAQR